MIKKYWSILVILILCIGFGVYYYTTNNKLIDLKAKANILSVLNDSIKVYKNKIGTLSYEREAFNVELKTLKKNYNILDKKSKELVNTISSLEKEKNLISATIIDQEAKIDSLINNNPTKISDKIYQFKDSTKYLSYNMFLNISQSPSLLIKSLSIPNNLYISHKFYEDKILVTVTNSNEKYYKVNDINSYIIPINKQKKNNSLLYGIGGFIGGVLVMSLK